MSLSRVALLSALITVVVGCSGETVPREKVSTIKYQGEKFEVIKPVSNFDYSDDRTFIREEDAERAERLILAAKVGEHYASQQELIAAIEAEVQFPGYSRTVLHEQRPVDPSDKSHVLVVAVEIPWRPKDRYLVFRSKPEDGSYDLVDDFVLEPKPAPKAAPGSTEAAVEAERQVISSVRVQAKQLRYLDPQGKVIREKTTS